MELDQYIVIFQKLATVGFPTLLLLVLFGSYAGVWDWGRRTRARESELIDRILELETSCTKREAHLQSRVDELFGHMINAANVVEKSARVVARGGEAP